MMNGTPKLYLSCWAFAEPKLASEALIRTLFSEAVEQSLGGFDCSGALRFQLDKYTFASGHPGMLFIFESVCGVYIEFHPDKQPGKVSYNSGNPHQFVSVPMGGEIEKFYRRCFISLPAAVAAMVYFLNHQRENPTVEWRDISAIPLPEDDGIDEADSPVVG